jgi:hypothetical protein
VAIFRLDYLSCFLTVLATVLMGRKLWPGLVVSIVNSSIVCVIGIHTSQFGFIPANVLHRHLRVQHPVVAQETTTKAPTRRTGNGESLGS